MTEHPFAPYIQILGKGRHGSRSLTQQEAREAFAMILAGEVEQVQLGAFLMLMRVKEETAEELAGFVQAARASVSNECAVPVDLDWASYAGKRRQLPWFLLSALLLASHGITVLMHGVAKGGEGRVYIPVALKALGLDISSSRQQAEACLAQHHFAFLPLEALSPVLASFIDLKPILGLRSPVHTVVRMLNPYSAPTSIMGIFHPGYDVTHQQAALLLADGQLAVFKGEGGEAERNPDSVCKLRLVHDGVAQDEEWPALFQQRHLKDEQMNVMRLAQLWRGEFDDEYAHASVVGTAAIALRAMARVSSPEAAMSLAGTMWDARDKGWLPESKG